MTSCTITELRKALGYDTTKTWIRFQGEEYLFVGNPERTRGAIATEEQYENFQDSYAHLCADGKIYRYRGVIGLIDDIEWLDDGKQVT